MTILRCQVRLPYTTGVPGDVATNTLHFFTPAAPSTQTEWDDIYQRVEGYYAQWGQYLASVVDRPNCRITLYDLADSEPRQPIFSDTFSPPVAVGVANLPSEVAVVHSYRGVLTSGQPPARRRNRIYLGPLSILATQGAGGGFARPVQPLIDDILTGGAVLGTDSLATGVRWTAYSPTDATSWTIVEQHVNNEFDTQRRRGVLATQKNAVPVTQP